MILAGDIGGTKANLALYERRDGILRQVLKRRYASADFSTFDLIINKFIADISSESPAIPPSQISAAGFGVAGPVIENRVQVTNLPWVVDGQAISNQLNTKHIAILNDLESTGYSLELLKPEETLSLNRGTAVPRATRALIAAGTGLGEAILFSQGDRYSVASSEGGHADFAPRTELEIDLLRHMKKDHPFVSVELLLSGRGFFVIHEFLDASVRHPSFDTPGADPAPEITNLALAESCPVCVKTLDLWVSMYGAEAGNLALKVLARGGVWVAGGIAPKIRKKMEDGTFFRAFCEKEKFGPVMTQIPILLVLNEEAPLLGAASQAARMAAL